MIKLINVSKAFGTQNVLQSISLEINKGERFCIMGRSGCGKTTLLNLIMGLQQPDTGKVEINNARLSCVFQENRLVPQLTAYKNIAIINKKADIYFAARQIGISKEMLQKTSAQLSGGEKRRVAILRAVLAESDAIVLDEVTKGLDDITQQTVISFVLNNLHGRALIAVTHSMAEAKAIDGTLLNLT